MLGFSVKLTPPGGSQTDYTNDVSTVHFTWPATTDLPTCTVQFSNQTGRYTQVPLFGQMAVTFPNGLGTFTFSYEKEDFSYTSMNGGGQNMGHLLTVTATAAPELTYMTEGNLDVVGTDLPVGKWNARSTTYVPYVSTFVPSPLSYNLLDIGNLLTALLSTRQPNQLANYRGRLGYDATGAGMRSAAIGGLPAQINYTGRALGLYIKGQWQVGLGSTGAQKPGIDLIRDVCQNNVIDGNGAPQVVDFFVDPTQTPPLLTAFERTSANSLQTFVVGKDPVMSVDLPVDTTSVKNFIIYWANAETVYPNSGDGWSNYDTTAHLQAAWTLGNIMGTGTWRWTQATPTTGRPAARPTSTPTTQQASQYRTDHIRHSLQRATRF